MNLSSRSAEASKYQVKSSFFNDNDNNNNLIDNRNHVISPRKVSTSIMASNYQTDPTTSTTMTTATIRPYFEVLPDDLDQATPDSAAAAAAASDDDIYIDEDDAVAAAIAQVVVVDDNNNPEDDDQDHDQDDIQPDFDEKDELNVPLDNLMMMRKKSIETVARPLTSLTEFGLVRAGALRASPAVNSSSHVNTFTSLPLQFSQHQQQRAIVCNLPDDHKRSAMFDYLDKLDFDERSVGQLEGVLCMCDSNRGLQYSSKDTRPFLLPGRLVLTNYRLQFLPYECDNMSDLFAVDRTLHLFNTKSSKWAVCIPLTFIYEVRASKFVYCL